MKNRKLKNYLKIGILLFGVSFLLENCENNNEENINLNFENSENLNLKTVSFQDAKNFFNVKNEEIKEERKLYARREGKTPLELTPNWNSIDHHELYGIEQAQLTLADVKINRSGDYISKLFFINRNDKMESIIFTIFQEEVDNNGKIIEAKMYFNEIDGKFIDGYIIERGKISKRITVLKKPNVQKASLFMFLQEREEVNEVWCIDGDTFPVTLTLSGGGSTGISPGPTSHSIGGFTSINVYSTGNPNTNSNYSGGGISGVRTSVTSVAGSLYTHVSNEKELAEGEGELISASPLVKYPPGSNYSKLYPKLTEYLKNKLPTIKDNSTIVNKIVKYGDLTASQVKSQLEWGKGPIIQVSQLDNACSVCSVETLGLFEGNNPNTLILDIDLVNDLENSIPNSNLANAFSFLIGVTILHEFVHYSEYTDGSWNSPESGELFEIDTYGQTVWRNNALIILKRN